MKKFLVLGATLLLAACQNANNTNFMQPDAIANIQSNQEAKVQRSSTFFPTDPDYVWQYDVKYNRSDNQYDVKNGTYTARVEDVEKVNGDTILTLRAKDSANPRLHFPVLRMNDRGVKLEDVEFFGFGAVQTDEFQLDFINFPLKSGERWDDGQWSGKVKQLEEIKVPAGTFKAWRIDVIGTHGHEYTAVGKYWITPGVGVVKSSITTPGWDIESELILAGPQRNR